MDEAIGIALVAVGAVVLLSGVIVGTRRSALKQAPAEDALAEEPSDDRRDEVEQDSMRRTRGEVDL